MCFTIYGYHAALSCAAGASVTMRSATVLVVLIDAVQSLTVWMCIAFSMYSILGMPSNLTSQYSVCADNASRTGSWRALRTVQSSHHLTSRPRNADLSCDGEKTLYSSRTVLGTTDLAVPPLASFFP